MAQTTVTLASRERGDEGNATALEHPQLTGRAAAYAVALFEAGAAGLRWREHFAQDVRVNILSAFAAVQITIGDDNMTPLDQRLAEGFDRLDPARTFEIVEINGRPQTWIQFDRRPAGLDDESAWRRVTLAPTAAEAMRAFLDAGDAGLHANEIGSRAKTLLAQAGVEISPVDHRWQNSFQRLDPLIEWRQAPPFSEIAGHTPPPPPRERVLRVRHPAIFDDCIRFATREFRGETADVVAQLIDAGDVGLSTSALPPRAMVILQVGCVAHVVDELTGFVRLDPNLKFEIIGDTTPKWSPA